MNNIEENQIIELLKNGKQFKKGHYHYGYIYYWYSEYSDCFCEKREDLSVDIFNPTIEEKQFKELEFRNLVLKNFDFKDFLNNLT